MGDYYRESTRWRERDDRDDYESDEERQRQTTVTRYKVPGRGERHHPDEHHV